MRFKDLEWKDVASENVVVSSHCVFNLCGVIKMEFKINHDPKDNQYYLYAFGKGSIRRLQPEKCGSIESAQNEDLFDDIPCVVAYVNNYK